MDFPCGSALNSMSEFGGGRTQLHPCFAVLWEIRSHCSLFVPPCNSLRLTAHPLGGWGEVSRGVTYCNFFSSSNVLISNLLNFIAYRRMQKARQVVHITKVNAMPNCTSPPASMLVSLLVFITSPPLSRDYSK